MFVAGVIGGAVVVGAASHGNHSNYSDYSCHSRHSQYREYSDSELVRQINDMQDSVNRQETDLNTFRTQMKEKASRRLVELKKEGAYPALSSASENIGDLAEAVKRDMKRELEEGIKEEQAELAAIDQMIARINEIDLQTGQRG